MMQNLFDTLNNKEDVSASEWVEFARRVSDILPRTCDIIKIDPWKETVNIFPVDISPQNGNLPSFVTLKAVSEIPMGGVLRSTKLEGALGTLWKWTDFDMMVDHDDIPGFQILGIGRVYGNGIVTNVLSVNTTQGYMRVCVDMEEKSLRWYRDHVRWCDAVCVQDMLSSPSRFQETECTSKRRET